MVKSMTGFARTNLKSKFSSGFCELRSLNHKHLDMSFKLPEVFRQFEEKARKLMKSRLNRGRIDCLIILEATNQNTDNIELNEPVVNSLIVAQKKLEAMLSKSLKLDTMDILKWPNCVLPQLTGIENEEKLIEDLFSETLEKLIVSRKKEGEELRIILLSKIKTIESFHDLLSSKIDRIQKDSLNKLKAKIEQMKETVDPSRLEQESVLLIQKLDVTEELDRINAHLKEITNVLKREEPIGRRLDFLLQELMRETNTLSSKSTSKEVISISIEIKVVLEQIREQVQNIE